jgi:hypothetical protein
VDPAAVAPAPAARDPRAPSRARIAEVEGAFVLLLSLLDHVRKERSATFAHILAGVTSATDRAALRLRM